MENQRKMNVTTRSKGLLKKASELATLCGIDVCLLLYDRLSPSTAPALTFPSDASQVCHILSHYQSHTGRVKDETHKYLPPQRTEPQIDLVGSRPERAIDCAADQQIDGDPIRTLVDFVDKLVAEAERIGSGEKEIRSFLRREEALRRIVEDLGVVLFSVRNRVVALLSRNVDKQQDFKSGSSSSPVIKLV